jgi:hypothetical protein
LTVFILVETATLCAAFFILLPGTIAQAYREDKTTAFLVEDSAVLSALPTAVARFAVGSGIAWQRVALAVVRDGALFMTLYLLCVALLVGGEDDVDLELLGDESMSDSGESAFRRVGWQEMEGGYLSTLIVHTRILTTSQRTTIEFSFSNLEAQYHKSTANLRLPGELGPRTAP